MIDQKLLEKYAELVLKMGVNLQKNQALMINSPLEGAYFTKIIARKAYEYGAKDVHINWSDDELMRLKYEHAPMEVFENFPEWRVILHESYVKDGAALISISATDPDALKGVDPLKVAAAQKASGKALTNFQAAVMNDKIPWSVISMPTKTWAKKIFPKESTETAVRKLWEAILAAVRVDQKDPIAAWKEHNQKLLKAVEVLNEKQYDQLIFKSSKTNLTIGLPKGHIWQGGAAVSEGGISFNPNMPTEEVFCMPHKYRVDGTVSSTMPLNYGGNLIENFTLIFKKGEVVDFSAEKGEDTLKLLLETDEGARRLGEVALVPHESPISKMGLIFYNTLFDENASCHLALGKAYPTNLENGVMMDATELDEHGANDSMTHVDFMIGSDDLDIDGIRQDGTIEPVFRKGTWAIEELLDE